MKYRVTVKFDRKNPVTGKKEHSTREGELYAPDSATAKKVYLAQFKKNEPTRLKIGHVTVVQIGEKK